LQASSPTACRELREARGGPPRGRSAPDGSIPVRGSGSRPSTGVGQQGTSRASRTKRTGRACENLLFPARDERTLHVHRGTCLFGLPGEDDWRVSGRASIGPSASLPGDHPDRRLERLPWDANFREHETAARLVFSTGRGPYEGPYARDTETFDETLRVKTLSPVYSRLVQAPAATPGAGRGWRCCSSGRGVGLHALLAFSGLGSTRGSVFRTIRLADHEAAWRVLFDYLGSETGTSIRTGGRAAIAGGRLPGGPLR